jgi:DNA-binding beta-propeller fold protein YncE
MAEQTSRNLRRRPVLIFALLAAAAGWLLTANEGVLLSDDSGHAGSVRRPAGSPQLVSIEPLPIPEGAECQWIPASAGAALSPVSQGGPTGASPAEAAKRQPVRRIHDPYPSFSSVAIDLKNDEVVLTDENLFQVLVYDRRTNTPPTAGFSEPKRMLGGTNTKIEFQCGVYVDPETGDIYAVNNDTVDTLVIFSREQRGNVAPAAELHTPHGTFGIAVSEARREIFMTVQHTNSMVVWNKSARNQDHPIRLLQGNATQLADPHGIAVDTKRGLIFVTNHGSSRELRGGENPGRRAAVPNWPTGRQVAGSGRMVPSSITVYTIDVQGDTAPLRVITGPRTRMNWPTGLAMNEETGELFVANDMHDEVLVFPYDAQGDAAPKRVLRGPKTGLKNPTGLNLDLKNRELWVANFGNHTATAYPLDAEGDTPPLRQIRSGPADEPALMIGNPGSVAYDSNREQILVPN